MTLKRVSEEEYIQFLLATPGRATCTEAERTFREGTGDAAHDAYNRLLYRQPRDTEALWQEASQLVRGSEGVLVLDDSTLDKPYARHTELVTHHWSGKHQAVVRGINVQTLLWTDGSRLVPCDFRVYEGRENGLTKNDTFRQMLTAASDRGMSPSYVLFDSWYSGLENLKHIRSLKWHWLTRLKSNRQVNPDGSGNRPVSEVEISPQGRRVHLRGYGWIKVFKTMRGHEPEYWATSDLSMLERQRAELRGYGWNIEVFHRGLKQCCAVERSQVRRRQAILGHIALSIRAFLRLEWARIVRRVSWYELIKQVWRPAVRVATKSCLFPPGWTTA